MNLPADLFLAFRYLRPKRTFVSLITLLSILGPALGVTVLIVVTSLMSGFQRDIEQGILDFQSPLQIHPRYIGFNQNVAAIEDPGPVLQRMDELGIVGAPVVEGPALIQVKDNMHIQYVRGIMPALEEKVSGIKENVRGKFDIEEGEAILGVRIAENLEVEIGDTILVHSPYKLTRNINWTDDGEVQIREPDEVYLPEEVTVAGIFSMGIYQFDSAYLYLHADQAATLMGLDWGAATSIHARTEDPFNIESEATALRAMFPGLRVLTWQEANQELFDTLVNEKLMMLFILFIIVLVASFCIAATLITFVVHKTREIAVMKAMGMGAFTVIRIFVIQGAIIGFFGTLLGTVMGVSLVHFRVQVAHLISKLLGHDIFPAKLYFLDELPGLINPAEISIILLIAFAICVAASLLPALYASCLSPVHGLQDEN